jgi:ketosteroid isomerase-like protein
MIRTIFTLAISLSVAAPAPAAEAPDPAPVFAAERAFAAPGGLLFLDKPVNVRELYAGRTNKDPGSLRWWPTHGGIARSGDLAFTTGPWVSDDDNGRKGSGWFFTVWARQPDGSWRYLADNGVPGGSADVPGPDAAPTIVPPGRPARAAHAALQAVETRLAAALATDAGALARHLAPEGRVLRVRDGMASGPEAAKLAATMGKVTLAALGGGASAAGDLAYSYGSAAWTGAAGEPRRGHYLRVWQHRSEGWRLLVDAISPAPPPAPKPAG